MSSKKFWDSEEFQKLNKKWQRKLEKSGFEDIEQPDGNLKKWSASYARIRYKKTSAAAKETYYRYAGQFNYDYTFINPVDRLIWQYHSEGVSIRDIAKILRKKRFPLKTEKAINQIIKKLAEKMKQHYNLTGSGTSDDYTG